VSADSPPWAAPLFGVELDVSPATPRHVVLRPLPATPAATRDLSLLAPDGVTAAELGEVIVSSGGELLESARPTAEYRGPALGDGQRSVTFRLVFRAPDRTLRDEEVDAVEATILETLQRRTGVTRRGA
jgi:phenylalanyl-tRNA synthetase beta chain